MEKQSSKGSRKLLRSTAEVYPFPAEQSRIERPRAWTDERQGCADRREKDVCQTILRVSESEREPNRRHQRAGKGRPQTSEQADACDDG